MTSRKESRILNNIVSPYGLAMFSYAFFLLACLIPPSIYSRTMMEPDLMFLDPATILFYTLCVMSFVAGVWLIGWLFPVSFVATDIQTRIPKALFLLLPLILALGLTVAALVLLIRQNPTIVVLLLSQRGGDLKQILAFDVQGRFTLAPIVLIGVTWWSFSRHFNVGLRGKGRWIVRCFLLTSVLCVIVASTILSIRNLLIMIVCGLMILYVTRKAAKNGVSAKFFFGSVLAMFVGVAVLFFATSFVRGTTNFDDQAYEFIGYTVASYNRLAAILSGKLHYPFGGREVYLSYVAAYSGTLNHIIPLKRLINPPDFIDLWGSEFAAVSQAGLDGGLIWSGAFGYIFSDLGWFSILFIFGYGVLYGFAWNWIKQGNVIGIVLYPCFGYCALSWLSTNSLFDEPSEILLVVGIALACYEAIFLKRKFDTPVLPPLNGALPDPQTQ